jgi:hypothetical protein
MSKPNILPKQLIFADFEATTDGDQHLALCCTAIQVGGATFASYGESCAQELLEWLPNDSIIYFHNLTYDLNFIMKHAYSVKSDVCYKNKNMLFSFKFMSKAGAIKKFVVKDSYSLIPRKLDEFTSLFDLDTQTKVGFPYGYYTRDRVKADEPGVTKEALRFVKSKNRESFLKAVGHKSEFSLRDLALSYCMQDSTILMLGFMKFKELVKTEIKLDVTQYLSISSLAQGFMQNNVYDHIEDLYEVGGKLLENLTKFHHGGRCMIRDNQKLRLEEDLVCLDYNSLYPSAISQSYILTGKPKTIRDEMKEAGFLIDNLFLDDQLEPTQARFISGFFVMIEITKINRKLHIPQIYVDKKLNPTIDAESYSNTCCKMMVDHIRLLDLIKYHEIEYKVIDGIFFSGKRNTLCRDAIKKLYALRMKYGKDHPLNKVIKLILNSIYGKTILRAIPYKYVSKMRG